MLPSAPGLPPGSTVEAGQQPLASPSIHRGGVQDGVHTSLTVPTPPCPAVASVITLWMTAWPVHAFPAGKAMPQCPQSPHCPSPGRQHPVPSVQSPRSAQRPKGPPPNHPQSLAGCCFLQLLSLWQGQPIRAQASPSAPAARASPFSRPHRTLHSPRAVYGCTQCSLDTTTQRWRLRVSQP